MPVASNDAKPTRVTEPLTVVKLPPAYTVEPDTMRTSTSPSVTSGFQVVAVPSTVLNAAIRFLVVPPFTSVNSPPAYTTEPERTTESTPAFAFGFQLVA